MTEPTPSADCVAEIKRVTMKTGLAYWCPNCAQKGLPNPRNGTLCKFCFEPVYEEWRAGWDESD